MLAGKIDAVEDSPATVMLAANPVKLAQQRKRSATGAAAAAAAAGAVPSGIQLPGSPGSSAGAPAPASPARVRQGLDRQAGLAPASNRLHTASGDQ